MLTSRVLQEINLMEKLSFDRNIVQFYGAVLSGTAPMLVLEYMEGKICSTTDCVQQQLCAINDLCNTAYSFIHVLSWI